MNISNPYAVMLKSLEDACGLTAYAKTLDFATISVAKNKIYQKNYTNYYRVRRDDAWLKSFAVIHAKEAAENLSASCAVRKYTLWHCLG